MRRRSLRHLAIGVALLTVSPAVVGAQTTAGFRAGFNVTTFGAGPLAESYGNLTGLYLAAFLDLPLSSSFGVQLGAGYSEKGGESYASSDPIAWENHIGYLDLPVLLTYQPFAGDRWAPHVLVGPALSIKTSCSITAKAPGASHTSDCYEGSGSPRTMDVGATAGVGARYDLQAGFAVGVDALYTLGIRTLPDAEDGVKNRALTLSLVVAFPVRRGE